MFKKKCYFFSISRFRFSFSSSPACISGIGEDFRRIIYNNVYALDNKGHARIAPAA